ncbi:MAG TPA: N-acyl homoserine lactonase family protein [Baekduia sp.]
MKIELFDVGSLNCPRGLLRQGDDLDREARLPIPAYVIETAGRRILVDTGPHPAAVADVARHYGRPDAFGPFRLEQPQSIAEQVDLSTITQVVLTHLHFDHAGALALVPADVPLVIQRREWEAGHDPDAIARNAFLPRDYAIGDRPLTLVDGDHDLLGDGAIRLLLTPGHTPGHQSVRVGERLIIGGDVAPFASALDDARFPIFGDDLAAQAASAQRLRALRDAGVAVLPGHDPGALSAGIIVADATPAALG